MPQCVQDHESMLTPDNAEFEIRKALGAVIELEILSSWSSQSKLLGIDFNQGLSLYKQAFDSRKQGKLLAAERWARTAKHLARAFKQEAKLVFLEAHLSELPCLEPTLGEINSLNEKREMTIDLIECVGQSIAAHFKPIPETMNNYLERARFHLITLTQDEKSPSACLRKAEQVSTAYEYGRTLECLILALEAETNLKIAA